MKKPKKKNQDIWDKAYKDVNKDWDIPSQKQYLLKDEKDIEYDDEQ